MTKKELLDVLQTLNREQEVRWMIDLGAELTVAARGDYPVESEAGDITHLTGFNELQHQVYNRLRHLGRAEEWVLEEFVDTLHQKATHYGIQGALGWAFRNSLRRLRRVQ